MAKDPTSLQHFASGAGDGIIKVWDLTSRDETFAVHAHDSIVKGLCWTKDGQLLSCASDKTVKLWKPKAQDGSVPVATYLGTNAFTGLSLHRSEPVFAVSSNVLSIYDLSRPPSTPLQTLHWPTSADTIYDVSFNQIETSILASCATDRSICIYDLRTSLPVAKTILSLSANKVAWNPMEAM